MLCVAIGEHKGVVVLQCVAEEKTGMAVVAGGDVRGALPTLVGRVGEAVGVSADAIYPLGDASLVHPAQEDAVVNRLHAVVDAGDGRRAADDQCVRVGGSHALGSLGHQRDEAGRIKGIAPPLAGQVGLVP